jgi:Ca2+-binding RTX toxin-like protein
VVEISWNEFAKNLGGKDGANFEWKVNALAFLYMSFDSDDFNKGWKLYSGQGVGAGFRDNFEAALKEGVFTDVLMAINEIAKTGSQTIQGHVLDLESFNRDNFFGNDEFNPADFKIRGDETVGDELLGMKDVALLHYARNLLLDESLDFYDIISEGTLYKVPDAFNAFHKDDGENKLNTKWMDATNTQEYIVQEGPSGFSISTNPKVYGTYNYGNSNTPGSISYDPKDADGHFVLDVYPWVVFGNLPENSADISSREDTWAIQYNAVTQATTNFFSGDINYNWHGWDGLQSRYKYSDSADTIYANQNSTDPIWAKDGNDTIYSSTSADIIYGGDGSDTVDYINSDRGIAVNLRLESGMMGYASDDYLYERLHDVENISGSLKADILIGDQNSNVLLGRSGNDILSGGVGNDVLNGGLGTDTAVYIGNRDSYNVSRNSGDSYIIERKPINGFSTADMQLTTEGSDTLESIEKVQFRDGTFDISDLLMKAPVGEEAEELVDGSGSKIGTVTIGAPTQDQGSEIEFSLNLSTSGVGTQYRVALIIDVSGSMGGTRIVEAKAAYVDLINYLKDQGIADVTEFAVIPFESSATLYEGLSADEAIARINSLSTGGGTEFGSAISRGLEFFDGAQAGLTQIAYFLSDGQGSGASADLQVVAEVRAFGISSGASISSLNTIDSNNAVILNSASDLAASFTESEIKTADVDKIEVYLNGILTQTITGDQLTDNGATGLTFSGTISGLDTFNADTLEAKVFFKDTSIPAQSVAFEVGDGTTEATSTDGDDRIVFSMSQQSVDAGGGIDNVFANDLDNNLIKLDGGGVIRLYGGNDNANLSGAGSTLQSPTPVPFALSRSIEPSVVYFALSATASASLRTNIILDGGTGTDTVTYTGIFANHTAQRAGGLVTVSWGTGVTDSLSNVEFLQFDDAKVRTSDLSVVQTLSASSVEIVESDSNTQMTITVKLDAASANDVTFDYATANGTAKEGRDFVAASGSITLLAGETQKTITIDVTGDTVFEGDETFELQLSNANGAVFDGSNGTYSITGIIKNDDDANQVETGSTGDDVINTGKGNDQINSGAGNDIVNANLGNDLVIDGLGNNSLNGEGGADAIIALSGLNTLTGGDGSDYLAGGFQADNLNGGAGNDVLRGDAGSFLGGSDILVGGADDDFLMGGRGADTFVFNTNDGSDVIAAFDVADMGFGPLSGYTATATGADFQSGVDHIQLAGFSTVDVSNVMSSVTDGADGAVFSAEGTSITFYDVAANQLTADDFIIV